MVEDGALAVEAWENGDWDVILMDVQMPNMDGVEATRAIRAREAASGRLRTPIIGLTANTMSHQIVEYQAAGMDAHVLQADRCGSPFPRTRRQYHLFGPAGRGPTDCEPARRGAEESAELNAKPGLRALPPPGVRHSVRSASPSSTISSRSGSTVSDPCGSRPFG